jgi:FRG domain
MIENREIPTGYDGVIRSVQDLILIDANNKFIGYRGHPDASDQLVPTLYRRLPPANWQSYFYDISLDFEKMAHAEIRAHIGNERNGWGVLALARHHGVPSPLLDWSTNRAVALHFAVSSHPDRDGTLWRYDNELYMAGSSGADLQVIMQEMPTLNAMFVSLPFYMPRLRAQSGQFSIHALPDGDEKFVPLDESAKGKIKKYFIPFDAKVEIEDQLSRIGINQASIYPDLDGIAAHIRWLNKLS